MFITISTGLDYSKYLQAAAPKIADRLVVTEPLPEDVNEDAVIQSRLMKTNFAKYLPVDAEAPIVLLDADLVFADDFNPANLLDLDTDLSATSWLGQFKNIHWPPALAALNYPKDDTYFLTTGVVIFKTLDFAKTFSAAWRAKYAELLSTTYRDVFSFNAVVQTLKPSFRLLSKAYNSPKPDGAKVWHDVMAQMMGGPQFKKMPKLPAK